MAPKLPETVIRYITCEHCSLPLLLNRGLIRLSARGAVLFQHNGLVVLGGESGVLTDPFTAPGEVVAPLVWVEMEGAVVESWDLQV